MLLKLAMPAHIIGTLNDTDSRQIQPRTTKSLSKEEYERLEGMRKQLESISAFE